ncbi:formin-mediated actin nucleation enhancer SKDI_12G3500 [Saccharomyces kudriavzevii IFO 1802]|uniref:Actin interacting protein 3 C-terminal domain-containing protein n=1 Tax=Saccharomyces kudriavzevii (strain ATCC MYA-4449 / AS 2.2408 / CBS 8840 / NBRC 1802 / NCYC 2889) TaxID=226230 RepID=A0AA35NIW0_SACK1|nr:uncharacterized protein SKDI_12G3500 [Saccharomyces kudriavzevii IFO 1802]CAI4046796.1 hypothetical protein SKDI_12G3500 [Saccharomyces kudriavzevii IFO 1802]
MVANESTHGTSKIKRTASNSSSIETTVTKLLMSTKHLLQILTQWSKGVTSGRSVSDAYVQLGNDFKVVSKFFMHAKVDMSDVGDVPMALRRVLEVTLREPPSDETLNKHLPKIREIIVALLDKLKVKQAILKNMQQEHRINVKPHHQQNPSFTSNLSLGSGSTREGTPFSSRKSSIVRDQKQSNSKEGMHEVKLNPASIEVLPVPPKVALIQPATNSISNLPSNATNTSDDDDALSQLKKGTNLQRRASKRYSAYHMAKLTNQSTTEAAAAAGLTSTPSPSMLHLEETVRKSKLYGSSNIDDESTFTTNNDKSIDDVSRTGSETCMKNSLAEVTLSTENAVVSPQRLSSVVTTKPNDAMNGTCPIFLKMGDKTKKCNIQLPVTKNALRLLFIERFTYSPGANSFPDIYIMDPQYGVFYELEEQNFHDVKEGFVIELRLEKDPNNSIKNFIDTIKTEISNSQNDIIRCLKEVNIGSAVSGGQSTVSSQPALEVEERRSPGPTKLKDGKATKDIQYELGKIKQVNNANRKHIDQTIFNILQKVDKFKSLSFSTKNSSNRIYMEKSQTELGDLSDTLLSRVDDLQDVIEIMRKDVAERRSQPAKKKLETVSRDLENAQTNLIKLQEFVDTEKPHWKKTWEAELDKVCEEQQFLTLQEELILDLKEDLGKALETFDLIKLCCEEQEKNPSRSKNNPILPIMRPGTFNQVREEVMVAVQSLNPDHGSRVEAIDRAEKMWQMERKLKASNEFDDELENFVGNSNLKKSGGFEEVERIRKQKDEANLRAYFGPGFG